MLKFTKINNKGITLVELIVSFAIVSFAIIYFYQTLSTVIRMYADANAKIKHSADVNYAFRLLDEAYNKDSSSVCESFQSLRTYMNNPEDFSCNFASAGTDPDVFDIIEITIDGEDYKLYKYPNNIEYDDLFDDE